MCKAQHATHRRSIWGSFSFEAHKMQMCQLGAYAKVTFRKLSENKYEVAHRFRYMCRCRGIAVPFATYLRADVRRG